MQLQFRLLPLTAVMLATGIAGCAATGASKPAYAASTARERVVEQAPGKVVYWVLPGPRQLSKQVFGTAAHPKMLVMPKVKIAKKMIAAHKMPPHVAEILQKLPILVGVPLKARSPGPNGTIWFKHPTPFGDKGRIITGSFTADYTDVVQKDPPGKPGMTPDKATMEAKFTDPAGNRYRVVLKHVVKPPFPGYETQGGVMIDSYHHGSTGTGSPLMPKVRTYAAFWGVGDVYINGKLAQPHRVMHMMTTEIVRDKNYHLALQEEMPLPPSRWIVKGQSHHTHLIILPIQVGKKGPVFKPLKTAFILPNGKPQPFIHVMYEQDTIVK